MKKNKNRSYSVNDDSVVRIYKYILQNEISDITSRVVNEFYYKENGTRNNLITDTKLDKKLNPFYDEMIKNAARQMWGNNTIKIDLPKHPERVIKEIKKQTDLSHFYLVKHQSLLAYLLPIYWKKLEKETGISPSHYAYDFYEIPLSKAKRTFLYIFRGNDHDTVNMVNQCLFGGSVHDSNDTAVSRFMEWANNEYLPKHKAQELKKAGVDLIDYDAGKKSKKGKGKKRK